MAVLRRINEIEIRPAPDRAGFGPIGKRLGDAFLRIFYIIIINPKF